MKAQELLIPRFEVIADYPNNYLGKIGDILEEKVLSKFWKISDYPHLFRKLNWWEKRTADQMPKKVMSLANDKKDTYEIEEWDMEMLIGWIDKKSRSCCSLTIYDPKYGYIPVD